VPGFAQALNYNHFVGTYVSQIQVNKFTVCFVFTSTEYSDINSNTVFDHCCAATAKIARYDVEGPAEDFTAYTLLEVPVTGTEIVSDDELRLTFGNKNTLTVFRRNDGHESMTINTPQGVIVID